VTAIARPGSARLQRLRRDNAIVDNKGLRADVLVAEALDETIPYDLVLVTLQAQQVDKVLSGLQSSHAKWIRTISTLNASWTQFGKIAVPSECPSCRPLLMATGS